MQILNALRRGEEPSERDLGRLVNAQAKLAHQDKRRFSKRRLLPFYFQIKREQPARWKSWDVSPELERSLIAALRMKPRRSASGVSTITVITKPWACSGSCVFCPSDIRMPKSYLHDEPACARAEQNMFDPYLQVSSRLVSLAQMGHAIDKIELIVLGGTWSDYPFDYQVWFISELFRALNECTIGGAAQTDLLSTAGPGIDPTPVGVRQRREWYSARGFGFGAPADAERVRSAQLAIDRAELSYNAAVERVYGTAAAVPPIGRGELADLDGLETLQHSNESARCRAVGLVIETRPDAVTAESLRLLRRLGCTKVQMGIQSLDQGILDANGRGITVDRIERACSLLRLFGFKTHVHFMVNLMGATPERDRRDYERLVGDPAFLPDEVKLYPCVLVQGARLASCYADGSWRPYTEDELIGVLSDDVLATPAFVRVSRMIRDFSANDILAGSKRSNLRQLVEASLAGRPVREIRYREIGAADIDIEELAVDVVDYETTVSSERFLQWVTPGGAIAGFLRLSLPHLESVGERGDELPIGPGEAMIREVHIYGVATRIAAQGGSAQHRGLGRRLIERACDIAREQGYTKMNVISAVGTRAYYRRLGFVDAGLYQQRTLI
ncbi:Histone acetyltransferase [Coriobacterium glomerans PW2]|uniref:tRNA carboxymethyluridine synthase n=1 Tax=Coriobacterium glomerans (strain ATCC 49209 / DSM 20642 / JCM 10262 / PW2) TaxID=700015 RepID=F2NBH4_CORGP|nr:Histone acetyltransferase [Coriobacterium glomerans PW2]